QEVRDNELTALVHLGALERSREQLQLGELDVLVDTLEHAMNVRPRLDELCGETERLRRRARVLEASCIGDDRDVERLGDLGRQANVELGEDVPQNLRSRRR